MKIRSCAQPCENCPWRKSSPPGEFPVEKYRSLVNTSLGPDGFKQVFACHKSTDGKEIACAGYVLRDGKSNIWIRIALAHGHIKMPEADGELYTDYREMAIANGVPIEELPPKEEWGR